MAGMVSSTGRGTCLLECDCGRAAKIPCGAGEDLASGRGTSAGRPFSRVRPTAPPTTASSPARTAVVAMGRRTSRARDPRCPASGSATGTAGPASPACTGSLVCAGSRACKGSPTCTGSRALAAFPSLAALAGLPSLAGLLALLNLPNLPGLLSSVSSYQKNHGSSARPTGGSPSHGDPPVTGPRACGSTGVTGAAPHLAHPVGARRGDQGTGGDQADPQRRGRCRAGSRATQTGVRAARRRDRASRGVLEVGDLQAAVRAVQHDQRVDGAGGQ